MIKEAIAGTIIAAILPAGMYMADSRYVKVSDYQQSVKQQRAWSLSDRIQEVKDKAAIENRALTAAEKRMIERLQAEIHKLESK